LSLYTCFSLVSINRDPTLVQLLASVFIHLGYNEDDIISTVQEMRALGKMFM